MSISQQISCWCFNGKPCSFNNVRQQISPWILYSKFIDLHIYIHFPNRLSTTGFSHKFQLCDQPPRCFNCINCLSPMFIYTTCFCQKLYLNIIKDIHDEKLSHQRRIFELSRKVPSQILVALKNINYSFLIETSYNLMLIRLSRAPGLWFESSHLTSVSCFTIWLLSDVVITDKCRMKTCLNSYSIVAYTSKGLFDSITAVFRSPIRWFLSHLLLYESSSKSINSFDFYRFLYHSALIEISCCLCGNSSLFIENRFLCNNCFESNAAYLIEEKILLTSPLKLWLWYQTNHFYSIKKWLQKRSLKLIWLPSFFIAISIKLSNSDSLNFRIKKFHRMFIDEIMDWWSNGERYLVTEFFQAQAYFDEYFQRNPKQWRMNKAHFVF